MNFKRPFPRKIYKNNSQFVWSWYTSESAFEKMSYVFKELPKVYELFIETFFPNLKNELQYYSGFKLLVININYASEFKNFQDSPCIDMFYLDTNENIFPTTKIYLNSNDCPLKWDLSSDYLKKEFIIQNIKYKLKYSSSGIIEYLYEKFTLREYLYKTLEDRFEKYFKSKTSYS